MRTLFKIVGCGLMVLLLVHLIVRFNRSLNRPVKLDDSPVELSSTPIYTWNNHCRIMVDEYSDSRYVITYYDTITSAAIVAESSELQIDSILEQRSYECEINHQKDKFNYKIE